METNTGYNILLIDDDTFLTDMYSLKFREGGHRVEAYNSGEKVLDLIKEGKRYDVIILDLVMPGIDGFTLLNKIREANLLPEATYIILSNQSRPADIDHARTLNADGYIIKASVTPSEVLREVEDIVTKSKK